MPLAQIVTDWTRESERLRAARCGVIEVAGERFVQVRLRRFARRPSQAEAILWGRFVHRWRAGDRCWLYFRQPRRHPNFLVLDYVISTCGTGLGTFRGALRLLDDLARLKHADAVLCDVATSRISDRLLARWGWAPHAPGRWHRQFIKRFYGHYPQPDDSLAALLASPRRPPVKQLALCG